MIYADNAATTQMCPAAIEAMTKCMTENYGNPSSLYAYGQQAREILDDARERIAKCLGCTAREITFTSGGSEADNQAIFSAAALGAKKGKKHIISTAFEHHAVLHTLDKLRAQGFEITLLDVHKNGIVTAQQVRDAIRDDTCLVTVMFANNEIGTIQPIAEIGAVCREKGVLFHTDAVQAVGHIKVNVAEQNIDMLSLSAHKFHGPKGIGVLYAKRGVMLSSLINGGAQERGKRAGTENLPAIVGMAAALEQATANLVDDKGICASSGSACTSGSLDPSHVLLAIGRPHEVAHGSLRLSLGDDATEADVDYIIEAVSNVVAYLRNMSPFWRDLVSGKRPHVFAE